MNRVTESSTGDNEAPIMKNLILSQAVLLLSLACFGEGTIWETKEDVYEST